MRREIAKGLSAVLHHPLLRATAGCTLSREFFGGMYGTPVVLYMARDLGFTPGILGTIWAVGGISSLLGAVATEPTTRRPELPKRLREGRERSHGLTSCRAAS